MTTLQVIRFQDIIRVAEVRLVPNLSVATVELKGEDFRFAETVALNDIPVPEFVIVDRQTIYAEVPPGVTQVKTVSVLSSKFTKTTKASKVTFEVGTKSRTVSGLVKLVQLFTKVLLQSPGSDIFDPEMGGGLQDLVGRITSTKRADRFLGAITQAISQTESQIKRSQLRTSGLPLEERLLAATILDIRTIKSLDEAHARVQIDNVAGQTGLASIEL